MDFEEIIGGIVIALFVSFITAIIKAWKSIGRLQSKVGEVTDEIKELKEADKKHESIFRTVRECDLRHGGKNE